MFFLDQDHTPSIDFFPFHPSRSHGQMLERMLPQGPEAWTIYSACCPLQCSLLAFGCRLKAYSSKFIPGFFVQTHLSGQKNRKQKPYAILFRMMVPKESLLQRLHATRSWACVSKRHIYQQHDPLVGENLFCALHLTMLLGLLHAVDAKIGVFLCKSVKWLRCGTT